MYGVIFDFNGTLFWDSEKHEIAWREFLKKYSNREITNEEFQKHVHGHNNSEILEYVFNKSLSKNEINKLSSAKEEIYRKLCLIDPDNFTLAPGAIDLLDNLKAKETPINIATASPKENVDFYFEYLNLGNWFDKDKVVCDDGYIPSKPNPTIYLKACENINANPNNVIVFEDSISGIQSAHNANIKNIIAIAPKCKHDSFMAMKEVSNVIENFYGLILYF